MTTSSLPPHVLALRSQALRLDMLGAHHHAEPLFSKVLAIIESLPTLDDFVLVEALNDLARCRFNDGQLALALHDYRRLLHLLDPRLDSALVAIAEEQIRRCMDGLRHRSATAALCGPIALLVRNARSGRAVEESFRQRRLRTVARRLLARGRVDTGARAMQQWLDDVLLRGTSLDADTMEDLRQHALALWHLKRPQAACEFFQSLARAQLRLGPDDSSATAGLLRDWAACLEATGQHLSARDTRGLAARIGGTA
ncbi:MAG: hypothetical protein L6Q69_01670 [Zoogloea sp.]|nr:hypothetical protein [Zoogloea sp.]